MQVAQLRTMAELYPDEVGFWVIGEGQLTFAQWDGQANRLARGMTKLGIGHEAPKISRPPRPAATGGLE